MDPPCHLVTKIVLPHIKRELARDLYDSGLSQAEISRKLMVSQAMVSKYLEGNGEVDIPPELLSEVEDIKAELSTLLEADAPLTETVLAMCQGCFRIRERGILCTIHEIENCNACTRLRYGDLTEDKRTVVEDINQALKLMESKDVSPLAPQVSMNIAQAARDAQTKMDVASIPGRISFVRGKPRAAFLPEFGASNHLSRLLLGCQEAGHKIRAVINIKLDDGVEKAIGQTSLKTATFDRKKGDLFLFVMRSEETDVILDHGDFGIEPCTYVLGSNAVDSLKKVINILGEYNNGK